MAEIDNLKRENEKLRKKISRMQKGFMQQLSDLHSEKQVLMTTVRMLEAELRVLKGKPQSEKKRSKPLTKTKCPGLELIGHGEFPSVQVTDLTAPHSALVTRLKEGKNLLCARFSTGGLLAIGDATGNIILANHGGAKMSLTAMGAACRVSGPVIDIAFHPTLCSAQEAVLAVGSMDGRCSLLRWHKGELSCTHSARAHSKFIKSVAFHPGGEHVASGSSDKTVCFYEVPKYDAASSAGDDDDHDLKLTKQLFFPSPVETLVFLSNLPSSKAAPAGSVQSLVVAVRNSCYLYRMDVAHIITDRVGVKPPVPPASSSPSPSPSPNQVAAAQPVPSPSPSPSAPPPTPSPSPSPSKAPPTQPSLTFLHPQPFRWLNLNPRNDEHVSFSVMSMAPHPFFGQATERSVEAMISEASAKSAVLGSTAGTWPYLLLSTDQSRHVIIRVDTGDIVRNFYGHSAGEYANPRALWSSGGRYVLSNSHQDSNMYCWCVATERVVATLSGHNTRIRSLDVHPQCNALVSLTMAKELFFWTPKS